jgi:hypothetical protein
MWELSCPRNPKSKVLDFLTPEADRLSRNGGKPLPLHAAQLPTTTQISSTSRWKPLTALIPFRLQQMSAATKHDSRQQFQFCLLTTTHYKQRNRRRSIARRAISQRCCTKVHCVSLHQYGVTNLATYNMHNPSQATG